MIHADKRIESTTFLEKSGRNLDIDPD